MNIDKLKELEAKATRGPWQVMPPENDKPYLRIRGTRLGYRYKITNVHDVIYEGVHERERQETESNADLLATLRNLAPHLIAVAEAARVFVASSERMRNAGAEYVKWCEGPLDKADAASSEMSAASTLHGIAIDELDSALTALENA